MKIKYNPTEKNQGYRECNKHHEGIEINYMLLKQ